MIPAGSPINPSHSMTTRAIRAIAGPRRRGKRTPARRRCKPWPHGRFDRPARWWEAHRRQAPTATRNRHEHRIRHVEFAQERFDRALAALGTLIHPIHGDADDGQPFVAIVARQVNQSGCLLPARSAPTGPIVDEHHLAAMIGETPGSAVELWECEVGHRGAIFHRADAGLLIAPAFDPDGDPHNGRGEEQIPDELSVVWSVFQPPSVYRASKRGGQTATRGSGGIPRLGDMVWRRSVRE